MERFKLYIKDMKLKFCHLKQNRLPFIIIHVITDLREDTSSLRLRTQLKGIIIYIEFREI